MNYHYQSQVVEPKDLVDFLNSLRTEKASVEFVLHLQYVDQYNRLATQYQVVYLVFDREENEND